jgi:hypothetical protein
MTQHPATAEQAEDGVFDIIGDSRNELLDLLTFDTMPTEEELRQRAEGLVRLAVCVTSVRTMRVMIGGAPYLMGPLERALLGAGFTPVYAFSKRESVEVTADDGTVRKNSIFKHIGFVDVGK